MQYSIKPDEHELRKARREVETVVDSYSYSMDVEEVEINLGWQVTERGSTFFTAENTLTLVIDPERDSEELERNVLRGLLEIEFRQKSGFEELEFNWQEVAKFAYVKNRARKLLDAEKEEREIQVEWMELREKMSEPAGEFDEDFYMKASVIGEKIGEKLLEEFKVDEIPRLNSKDLVEAGDQVFGDSE